LSALRRELEDIEKRMTALAAERALVEAELFKDPMQGEFQARYARLARDAEAFETRWMEIGTAIEAAEALTPVAD
jgi:uncharacterized protein involved in exopolysaccharide biosynthesis